ncbi:hypothetical protein HK096_008928 [Nowakowskiella sp. JEL0078]|nr:hypothetical protein HK096_008928 [Nowakowskiella sp. JEL0078]
MENGRAHLNPPILTNPHTENPKPPSHPFMVDNGSNHVCIYDYHFFDPTTFIQQQELINTLNAKSILLESIGKGIATVHFANNLTIQFHANFCPKAPCNIISTNELERNGYWFGSANLKAGAIYHSTAASSQPTTNIVALKCIKNLASIGFPLLTPPILAHYWPLPLMYSSTSILLNYAKKSKV